MGWEFAKNAFNLAYWLMRWVPRSRAERHHLQSSAHNLGRFICLPPADGDIVNADAQSGRRRFDPSHLEDTQSIGETNDLGLENVLSFRSLPVLAGTLICSAPATRRSGTITFLSKKAKCETR
jgi:hypothetical protein